MDLRQEEKRTVELFTNLKFAQFAGMIRINKPINLLHTFTVTSVLFLGFLTCLGKVIEQAKEDDPDMFVLVEALHWVGILGTFVIAIVRIWVGTEEYLHLFNAIKAGIFTYTSGLDDDEIQLLEDGNKEAYKLYKLFIALITCGCFSSMLRDPIFGGNISEEGSEVTRLKFYNTWFPFTVNTWTRYAAVCTFQFFLGISVLVLGIATFSMITICLIHLSTSFKVLESKISKAHYYARNFPDSDKKFEDYLYERLRECAKHHQTLIRFFSSFKNLMNLLFLTFYLNSGVIICAVGYILTGPDSNLRSSMAFISVVTTEMIFFGGNCYFGERLIQTSAGIHEAVYNVPWYTQPKKVIFLYQMIMVRSKKPLEVSAFGLKSMSLSTFADILQASYSYFNMLLAARN
nr:olfactory receptor 59 [Tropidothorax elegans]